MACWLIQACTSRKSMNEIFTPFLFFKQLRPHKPAKVAKVQCLNVPQTRSRRRKKLLWKDAGKIFGCKTKNLLQELHLSIINLCFNLDAYFNLLIFSCVYYIYTLVMISSFSGIRSEESCLLAEMLLEQVYTIVAEGATILFIVIIATSVFHHISSPSPYWTEQTF